MNLSLLRYHDGMTWTFWTGEATPPGRSAPADDAGPHPVQSRPPMRSDIAAARSRVNSLRLLGSEKEIGLLESRLASDENVLELASAVGTGIGVLACTNRRLLFLYSGLLREQFLAVDWNQASRVVYNVATKRFQVYVGRVTKRSIPVFDVIVKDKTAAIALAGAAERASAAPRLDMLA